MSARLMVEVEHEDGAVSVTCLLTTDPDLLGNAQTVRALRDIAAVAVGRPVTLAAGRRTPEAWVRPGIVRRAWVEHAS